MLLLKSINSVRDKIMQCIVRVMYVLLPRIVGSALNPDPDGVGYPNEVSTLMNALNAFNCLLGKQNDPQSVLAY